MYNPFSKKPPTFIKIDRYRYRFSNPYRGQKNWYERMFSNVYLPPMKVSDPRWQVFMNERFSLK